MATAAADAGESPVHTVYLAEPAMPRAKIPNWKPSQVKTGITDNIHTEVLSGLKEGDQVVTGLAIPGLTQAQKIRNPFGFSRQF